MAIKVRKCESTDCTFHTATLPLEQRDRYLCSNARTTTTTPVPTEILTEFKFKFN